MNLFPVWSNVGALQAVFPLEYSSTNWTLEWFITCVDSLIKHFIIFSENLFPQNSQWWSRFQLLFTNLMCHDTIRHCSWDLSGSGYLGPEAVVEYLSNVLVEALEEEAEAVHVVPEPLLVLSQFCVPMQIFVKLLFVAADNITIPEDSRMADLENKTQNNTSLQYLQDTYSVKSSQFIWGRNSNSDMEELC